MDSSEFNRIVDKFADVVFRSALNFCGNKSDAEDTTQNAFIKLLKSNVDFENDDHIRKWLIRVVANESKSLWRSSWQRKVISFNDLEYEPEYIDSKNSLLSDESVVNEIFNNFKVIYCEMYKKISVTAEIRYEDGTTDSTSLRFSCLSADQKNGIIIGAKTTK